MSKLPEKLKELRKIKNLNQTKVANNLGVQYYTLGKWEQGRAEPSIEDLHKLADFFDCSVDYLIGREDELGNVAPAKSNVTEKEARLLKAFSTLSTLEQDKLIADAEFYSLRHLAKMDQ